jgi:hypothetical protein
MSTDYRLLKDVLARDLFDGRLEVFGVHEYLNDETTEQKRLLTDGRNYLWLYIDDSGFVSCLTRYMPNGAPSKILSAIVEAFDTGIVSEYEPQFWGFETQEDWDAWQLEIAKEHEEEFYREILKYVQGKLNDIRPGTIGMIKAEIAKKLVDGDPTLLLPANKHKFRAAIESTYDCDHAVFVELCPQDLAAAKMMATHEDDLPRA